MIPRLAVTPMRTYVAMVPEGDGPCNRKHLFEMLAKIGSGEVAGEKAHRWLAWVQAACCAAGAGTLEDFKAINKAANYRLPSALIEQVAGSHYKVRAIQPVEFWSANRLDAFQGAVVKYIVRHREKNGAQDLQKAIHYTQLYLELEYGVRSTRVEFEAIK